MRRLIMPFALVLCAVAALTACTKEATVPEVQVSSAAADSHRSASAQSEKEIEWTPYPLCTYAVSPKKIGQKPVKQLQFTIEDSERYRVFVIEDSNTTPFCYRIDPTASLTLDHPLDLYSQDQRIVFYQTYQFNGQKYYVYVGDYIFGASDTANLKPGELHLFIRWSEKEQTLGKPIYTPNGIILRGAASIH